MRFTRLPRDAQEELVETGIQFLLELDRRRIEVLGYAVIALAPYASQVQVTLVTHVWSEPLAAKSGHGEGVVEVSFVVRHIKAQWLMVALL